MRLLAVVIALSGCGRLSFERLPDDATAAIDDTIDPDALDACTITSVAIGQDHMCVLVASGLAYCAGDNEYGALGNGSPDDSPVAVRAPVLDGSKALYGGRYFTCRLDVDDRVQCLGYNTDRESDPTTGVNPVLPISSVFAMPPAAQVTVGLSGGCILTMSGEVICWGDADEGESGLGSAPDQHPPELVTALGSTISVSMGTTHVCAVDQSGVTRCWGDGRDLRMNAVVTDSCPLATEGPHECALTPVVVGVPTAKRVAAADIHTCIQTENDEVWCWGGNEQSQLGVPSSVAETAVQVAIPAVRKVIVGRDHTCALYPNGDVECWGDGADGQLGYVGAETPNPVAIELPGPAIDVITNPNADFTCATLADRSVHCWGANGEGQLGRGMTSPSEPVGAFSVPCP